MRVQKKSTSLEHTVGVKYGLGDNIFINLLIGSVYSVVAVAVERYFTICKPFNYNIVRIFAIYIINKDQTSIRAVHLCS